MTPVVLAGYARSPFTFANKGALAMKRPDDLAAEVIKGLVERENIDPALIEDLILGCAFPEGEQGFNMARLVGLMAGLPETVAGVTVNRFCGSSMQAIHMAAGAIQLGAGEAFICAGVESMSRVPMGGFNPMPNPDLYENNDGAYMPMGETAENLAEKYQISRQEQEAFALTSQTRASEARSAGRLKSEIIPVETNEGIVDEDACLRPETTLDGLSSLEPAFDAEGSVTAGTSSPLTDGAAAVLVCTEAFAQNQNLKPIALLKSIGVSGVSPQIMGIGPVQATEKALERASLKMEDLDIIELNEAFAVQALACTRELPFDSSKINIDGGAIAIGHPLGATGARITGKAAQILQREDKKYALATQCIGGGQGISTILEAA
ncbi:MAG: acetyl-CoA C-acyltransferase [Gammaproteobacteria bacterium]|jgi:acetyl-CoA acyltransferase|nr:acetyl-CoA C-acyltransferase [Gammaproteobacteria bacterium]|tara:strand:+ start:3472 stop:4608 length:1137 start_codon:yes stop_codon:yes gene_type:complete